MTEHYKYELESFRKGSAHTHELQAALEDCWINLAKDPERRAEMAAVLGISPAEAEQVFRTPLVRIDHVASGSSTVDVAIVVSTWIASEIVLGVFKDMAKAKLKATIERLWAEIVKPALLDELPQSDSLGAPGTHQKDD